MLQGGGTLAACWLGSKRSWRSSRGSEMKTRDQRWQEWVDAKKDANEDAARAAFALWRGTDRANDALKAIYSGLEDVKRYADDATRHYREGRRFTCDVSNLLTRAGELVAMAERYDALYSLMEEMDSDRVTKDGSAEHTKDEDCDVDPETDCCRVCGVHHAEPCPECGGCGFHRGACSLSDG